MAIYRLLRKSSLGLEEISRLTAAYEQVLWAFGLKDRNDPITRLVAKKIIEIRQTGIRDPTQLSKIAIQQLLASNRVLIIEDEYFLAKDLEDALNSFGVNVMGLVSDMDEALDQIAKGGFEVAVVDIGLRERNAYSVADELHRKAIPFVFTTGYGAETIPVRFADVTVWEKPFEPLKVALDVAQLCQRQLIVSTK
jgi:CheY-like chemotaxis protein